MKELENRKVMVMYFMEYAESYCEKNSYDIKIDEEFENMVLICQDGITKAELEGHFSYAETFKILKNGLIKMRTRWINK